MKNTSVLTTYVLLLGLLLHAGCTRSTGDEDSHADHHEESPEGHKEPEGHEEDVVELSSEAVDTARLQGAAVTRAALGSKIDATATIKANEYRMAHVSPRISGKAFEVSVELGDLVRAGETLAELDSIELGQRKAEFLQARASLDVARRNHEREKRLFGQKISSEREYLEAKGEFDRSRASYRAAREALRLLGLRDEKIENIQWGGGEEPLSHFPLVAPFAGTVIERHITLGELIEPDDKPFTIADLSDVWIVIDLYEKDLAQVRVGMDATVTVDAYPERTFPGKVTYLSHLVDPSTRTLEARVVVENADGSLRPGMFARAVLAIPPGETAAQALVAPADAVQQVRGSEVVFVDLGSGKYEMRQVELGQRQDDAVEIRSGLAEGERVVTSGSFYLKSSLLKEEMGGHEH